MSTLFNNAKVFEFFPLMPAELRMMVVDEMDTKDRCQFTRCSTLSCKEGRSSKKFMKFLLLLESSQDSITIEVGFAESEENRDDIEGFTLTFCKKAEKNCMEYKSNLSSEILWTAELDDSIDLAEHAEQHFKRLSHSYQKSIKRLTNESKVNTASDLKIDRLRDLEELHIKNEADPIQFLLKTRRPLHCVIVDGKKNDRIPEDCKPIYKVQSCLSWPHLKLSNEQFLKLSAEYISIHIGELTVEDIHNFIKSWQDGMIEKQFVSCTWHVAGSDFDVPKLFKLLEEENQDFEYSNDNQCLKTRHRKKAGKSALISNYESQGILCFETFDY